MNIIIIIIIILIILLIYYYNQKYKNSFIKLEDRNLNCNNLKLLSDKNNFNYEWFGGYKYNKEKFKENKFGDNLSKEKQRKETLIILKHFHKACEKKKVKMYISHGTLLGAYRHKGFIPWDDDIDTTIFKEYINEIHSEEFAKFLPKHIKIMKGYLPCHKDTYKNYCTIKKFDMRKKINNHDFSICKNINNGVYIDIFHLNTIEQKGKVYYDLTSRASPSTMIEEKTKNAMEPSQKLEFEGHFFNAPNNTMKLLCTLYNKSINIEGQLNENIYILNNDANNGFAPNKNLVKGDLYLDNNMEVNTL